MTCSDLINHAITHDDQAAYLRARDAGDKYAAENISYHAAQRNWACDHLRGMGFDLPATVYDKPEVLRQALAELADRVKGDLV